MSIFNGVILAFVQAATEFFPVSSSGHLALLSSIISEPNLFFFTALHLASLIAVVIFLRKEIMGLFSFNAQAKKMWLYLIIATIPALLFGLFLHRLIENVFSSLLFVGISFIFTGIVLFFTKFAKESQKLNARRSIFIGLFQALALFPGISRSGMTISSALFLGIERTKAVKFSFLLFIPISLGAFILEAKNNFYLDLALIISFFTCLIFSYIFLKLLFSIVKSGRAWVFSIYCVTIGIISLIVYTL